LPGAFAALARSARRQQYLYFATIVTLTVIVVVSGLLVAVLAAARHLDYRRAEVVQYAANVSLLLNREASFLRRTELTVHDALRLPRRRLVCSCATVSIVAYNWSGGEHEKAVGARGARQCENVNDKEST